MQHSDLLDPQTEQQEAENAAYIAQECERIRIAMAYELFKRAADRLAKGPPQADSDSTGPRLVEGVGNL